MLDRRVFHSFDWGLLAMVLILSGCGLAFLFSAVSAGVPTPEKPLFFKQLIWFGSGLLVVLTICWIPYKLFDQWAYVAYGCCLVALAAVLVIGIKGGGAQRWLAIGPFTLQPSEPAKLCVLLVLARYYAHYCPEGGLTFRNLARPLVLVALPVGLIVRQPDLGTAMLILILAASLTVFIGIEKKTFGLITLVSGIALPSIWFFLHDYQKQRILTFLNPERDPLGAGYHIIQSKIAIGSGMVWGKGYLKGSQNALSFLPEQHTDFIFSVLGEEWGFVGTLLILLLILLIIGWGLNIAQSCRDAFGTILAVGIVLMFAWQATINIAMVMGLMPVVGVPLPLISYGGSSMLTMMAALGILMSISMRRFVHE